MSHEATNWAIKQRGLKPTTKIVLWHLCDRFNPDYGCFPSQERLAHDCEISRSTLNEHLGQLEAAGLLRRVPRIHPVTKRQMPTRYILGFEPGFTPHAPDPCPESGHGHPGDAASVADIGPFDGETPDMAEPCLNSGHGCDDRPVSDFAPNPCPENRQARVRNPDTNPVREPLSKPVKEEEDARAREAIPDDFFEELLKALGLDPTALPGCGKAGHRASMSAAGATISASTRLRSLRWLRNRAEPIPNRPMGRRPSTARCRGRPSA